MNNQNEYQQKAEERIQQQQQQQFFLQFHKEQEEKQQQQQQRWEEKLLQQQKEQEDKLLQPQEEPQIQRKQQEELFLKVLNKTEPSENNTAFFHNTIWNSMETFIYLPEEDKTFKAFFRKYEDLFTVDCEDWFAYF